MRAGYHRGGVTDAFRGRRPMVVVAVFLVAAAALSLPSVRTVLRQSFTRIPQPYTAMYFTTAPTVTGTVLRVPVTVQGVDTDESVYGIRVWTVTAAGKVGESTTAAVHWNAGAQTAATVVTMPVQPDAAVVWVSLDGSQESLHFKIATS